MDTRSLLYFIAVTEERNVGRAAARLHITQPALTRQIRSLEEELGVLLFTRAASGMEITPAGTALLEHARTIRAELEQAKTSARGASDVQRHPFDIGVYGSAIFDVVPRILVQFIDIQPNVEFRLHITRKDQQIELLRQGKTLIAFDRFIPHEPDIAFELVCHETLCVVLHEEHPLSERESIDVMELNDELRIGANTESAFEANLAQVRGFRPRISHRTDDVLSSIALVACGFGISFAPSSLQALKFPHVVFRPCTGGPTAPFNVQCMYRKGERSPLLLTMLETIRAFRSAHANKSK